MVTKSADGQVGESSAEPRWKTVLDLPRRALSLLQLPLPFSERRLLLACLDLLAVNGALALIMRARDGGGAAWRFLVVHPIPFLTITAVWLVLAHVFDAYNLRISSRFSTAAPAVTRPGIATAILCFAIKPSLYPEFGSPILTIGLFCLLIVAFLLVGRGLYLLALFQPVFQRRVLIVGAGWAGRTIAETLKDHGDGTYWLVGYVDDDPVKQGATVPCGEWQPEDQAPVHRPIQGDAPQGLGRGDAGAPLQVLGRGDELKDLIPRHRVTTLILAITHEVGGDLLQVLMDCLELGVEIVAMPVLYEQLTGRVPVEHVGDNWYVAMPVHHPGTGTMWPIVKRFSDIVLSTIGLLFLAPLTPLIALAIYMDGQGPIFYTQERVGKGGHRFQAYKFRSMVPDAERGEAVWAGHNDQRVTRVGRILRRTHVDELPQFLNILKGEMSAVGPRPERPEFVEELAQEIPFFRARHAVRPGMAGWALVRQGYSSSREAALLKLQYDLYYVKHQSLWLDLVILLKTFVDSVTLKGR